MTDIFIAAKCETKNSGKYPSAKLEASEIEPLLGAFARIDCASLALRHGDDGCGFAFHVRASRSTGRW